MALCIGLEIVNRKEKDIEPLDKYGKDIKSLDRNDLKILCHDFMTFLSACDVDKNHYGPMFLYNLLKKYVTIHVCGIDPADVEWSKSEAQFLCDLRTRIEKELHK